MEIGLVESEVVADLVDDRPTDLYGERSFVVTEILDKRKGKEGDARREFAVPLAQSSGHPLEESVDLTVIESVFVAYVLVAALAGSTSLDHEDQFVGGRAEWLRECCQCAGDKSFDAKDGTSLAAPCGCLLV